MQRTIEYWLLVFAAACMKGGKQLLSSRTFTSQDVAPLETPRTKHVCETTPFLHRTVAHLPKFHKSCEIVIFSAITAGFNELSKGNQERVSLHIWILIKLWSSRTTKSVAVSMVSTATLLDVWNSELHSNVSRFNPFINRHFDSKWLFPTGAAAEHCSQHTEVGPKWVLFPCTHLCCNRDSSFFFLLGKTNWTCCLRLQQGISASGSQDKRLKWLPLVLVPSHLLEVLAAFVSLCTMSRQVQRPCCFAKNLAHCCPQKSRTVSAPPKYATTQNLAAQKFKHCRTCAAIFWTLWNDSSESCIKIVIPCHTLPYLATSYAWICM